MIDKAIRAAVEDGVKALQYQADGIRNGAKDAAVEAEKYKRIVEGLAKVADDVRSPEFFKDMAALKVGEVQIHDGNTALVVVQIGQYSHTPLTGYPRSDDKMPPGRYRVTLMLQRVGDL